MHNKELGTGLVEAIKTAWIEVGVETMRIARALDTLGKTLELAVS